MLADEPALPAGLGEDGSVAGEPTLPEGLDSAVGKPDLPVGQGESADQDPSPELPAGLDGNALEQDFSNNKEAWSGLSGFWDARFGLRTQQDPHERRRAIAETRLQLDFEHDFSIFNLRLVTDFIYDDLADSRQISLESGQGWLDLREVNLSFTPTEIVDIKIGRQILTWGSGDLLFINDLFPKDWQAFFMGREVEYLKAPSDAIKASFFNKLVNLDIVYIPRFDADRFIDGSRISFFSPQANSLSGRNAIIHTQKPTDSFNDHEVSLRLYKNIGVMEAALYAYDGFWKSPAGFNPVSGQATFPALRVYGASLRMPAANGIANFEVGYYDSRDDSKGRNPFINNSEFRLLAGYEQEIGKNLTLGLQYYLEQLLDYSDYKASLPVTVKARDHNRHLFTLRVTKMTHQQNMLWSLFIYASPSDQDVYLRPHIQYKIDDSWRVEAGANIFSGKNKDSFFGQFQDNTNFYGAVRFSF